MYIKFQSFTTISSGIAPEADLGIGEDKGVNTSTRDLVLAAISVMKGKHALHLTFIILKRRKGAPHCKLTVT